MFVPNLFHRQIMESDLRLFTISQVTIIRLFTISQVYLEPT